MISVRDAVAIDLHASGEPGRVAVGGVPDVPRSSLLEKIGYFKRNSVCLAPTATFRTAFSPASSTFS
jgi:proline racemase